MTSETETKETKTEARGRGDRREAILDVATEIFLSEGYASASMSTIAARLGGSKGTLYNYFKSKEELFVAYVQRNCALNRAEIASLLMEDGDLRLVLTGYGKRFLRVFTSNTTLQHWRVVTAESVKSPDIGRLFYESGPLSGAKILADYLQKAKDRGELNFPDALLAAHQFTSLIHGRLVKARLLNFVPVPSDEEIAAEVNAGLHVFFSAYGTEKLK